MLLYEYRIRDEFDRVRRLATRMKEKFDRGVDARELLEDRDILEHACERLLKALPGDVAKGSTIMRHSAFMKYYLERDERERTSGDFAEVAGRDLTLLEDAFKAWLSKHGHFDQEFAKRIADLLYDQRLGDAIRAAFVVLTDRLRAAFKARSDLDGRDLVNSIFGSGGLAAQHLEQGEREAMRALLDGLYGVHRNRYAHADAAVEWYEAEAALSMVNWTLMWLQNEARL
jgi:Protein of unknown function (Hypoth_ymh)